MNTEQAAARPAANDPQRSHAAHGVDPLSEAANRAAGDHAPELDLWSGRTHWMHFIKRISLWLLACIALAALLFTFTGEDKTMTFGTAFLIWVLVFIVSGAVVLGKVILVVWGTRYRLTTQRLFIEKGILSKTIDQTELIRIDDVRLYKSLTDRVFGLGTVSLVSSDATHGELLIPGIRKPETMAESIRTRMHVLRKKSLFVEQL